MWQGAQQAAQKVLGTCVKKKPRGTMWQRAQQAAQKVLGTRVKKKPELHENEWTSPFEGECKEDEWTRLLEDEKEDVNDLEVAKDLGYVPIGATVQFHDLKKDGARCNGLSGRIEKVYEKAPGEERVYRVMIVMNDDDIEPVKVLETNIWKLPDIR